MKSAPRVLVVAPTTRLANALLNWLAPFGYEVLVATTYPAGRDHLALLHPDLVITELKLGEFNGLQLAIRASATDVPTIVVGVDDPVLQGDARHLGVSFLTSEELSGERLHDAIETLAVPAVVAHTPGAVAWRTLEVDTLPKSATAGRRMLQH